MLEYPVEVLLEPTKGIESFLSPVQPLKAFSPTLATDFGIDKSVIIEQLSNTPYGIFVAFVIVTDFNVLGI